MFMYCCFICICLLLLYIVYMFFIFCSVNIVVFVCFYSVEYFFRCDIVSCVACLSVCVVLWYCLNSFLFVLLILLCIYDVFFIVDLDVDVFLCVVIVFLCVLIVVMCVCFEVFFVCFELFWVVMCVMCGVMCECVCFDDVCGFVVCVWVCGCVCGVEMCVGLYYGCF